MSQAATPQIGSTATPDGFTTNRRNARVLLLLLGVLLMSLADLRLTLMYLQGPGMPEDNPIARWVIGIGSPGALICFKLVCVLSAAFVLYRARRTAIAEIGIWVAFLAFTWLCFRWMAFTDLTPTLAQAADAGVIVGEHWLRYP